VETTDSVVDLALALKPGLGIGMSYEIVPNRFVANAGVGADQTLFSLSTGTQTVVTPDLTGGGADPTTMELPLVTRSWGKPAAKLALGATFILGKGIALDAMFSANGITDGGVDWSASTFVLQFSARF
jgi:hypothetical protein